MAATVVSSGSKLTVARSVARLTEARSTPSTLPIAFSTRLTQDAQVIPLTGKLTSSIVGVGEEPVIAIVSLLLSRSIIYLSANTRAGYHIPCLQHTRCVKGVVGYSGHKNWPKDQID